MDSIQNFFIALPSFIILIGVLIFVHESGHFFFAKLFKVKVHVFSLGFGPKLIGFEKGETQYKIALVPIGGYVKMLGEDPSEDVPPEDRGRAFGDKPLFQRFLIIAAGPVMNIIFPLFLHFGVGLSFHEMLPAEIGVVPPGTPAYLAGIRPGDIIDSIDDKKVSTFSDLVDAVAPRPGERIKFVIRRGDDTFERTIVPEPNEVTLILDEKETVGRIGVGRSYLSTLIGLADPKSTASQAGLKSFDLVLSVGGKPVSRLIDLEKTLVNAAGSTTSLRVKRFKSDAEPPFQPFDAMFEKNEHVIQLTVPPGTDSLQSLGIESANDFVAHVTPKGVADSIGLKRGDRLVSLDGKPYPLGQIFYAIDTNPKSTRTLAWIREGKTFQKPFKPKFIPAGEAGDLGIKQDQYDKGFWGLRGQEIAPKPIPNPAIVSNAMKYAVDRTWYGIKLIGIGFKLLFQGRVSLRSLGGPLMIGQLAGQAAQHGASTFFWMMAFISLNLGLLNLLPIPVLDGGQIVFIVLEAITQRPINRIIKERVMIVGVAMLLLLMVFATWNDIARLVVG